jgi:hypothetical protein
MTALMIVNSDDGSVLKYLFLKDRHVGLTFENLEFDPSHYSSATEDGCRRCADPKAETLFGSYVIGPCHTAVHFRKGNRCEQVDCGSRSA